MPLGIFPGTEYISCESLELQSGDMVVALTDGFLEAQNIQGEEFGEDRVLSIIRENLECPAGEIVKSVFDATKSFVKNMPITDDWTLVIMKVR
jgi:sigma-B regulation protein RsbU (phosphoserine phosphatase)